MYSPTPSSESENKYMYTATNCSLGTRAAMVVGLSLEFWSWKNWSWDQFFQ